MIKHTLAAALATTAVIVPAGWRALDADIQTDGPEDRPALQTVRVGDATVGIQLDRGTMLTGGTVSGVLVATSDRPHAVTVDVSAIEDMGFTGERVPVPPEVRGEHTVTLQAQPGGGPPVVTTFKLGKRRESKGHFDWFELVVTAARGTHDRVDHSADDAARVEVTAWSGNTIPIAIEPPASIPAEGPFTVAVRIKNTTGKPLEWMSTELGAIRGHDALGGTPMFDGTEAYTVSEIDDAEERGDLQPGAERLVLYRITPTRPGLRRFTLTAFAQGSGAAAADMRTFERPEPAPPSLAAR